jgi:hypothetical protein
MKKVAFGVAAFLTVALPAFAFWPMPKPPETRVNNFADVDTATVTVANTGLNFVGGRRTGVMTGPAAAESLVKTDVNYTQVACGTCSRDVKVNNFADVDTLTVSAANTGLNFVHGGRVMTGAAYAGSEVDTFVNTTVVGNVAL